MKLAPSLSVLLSLSAVASAQHWFDALRIYPETNLGQIRIVEDMDADGDVDLVWIDEDAVQVWSNDGQGEFTRGPLHVPATPLVLPTSTLYALQAYPVAGDVDGDGRKDIVIGTNLGISDAVFVTLFAQADGSFVELLTDIPASPGASLPSLSGIAVGDINLDGDLEIATAFDSNVGFTTYTATITWWNWHGTFFRPSQPLVLTGPLTRLTHMTSLEATGDGRADLAVAGYDTFITTAYTQILPTVSGKATAGTLFTLPHVAVELAAGDIDSDGDEDLISAGRKFCPDYAITAFVNQGGGAFAAVASPLQPLQETSCAYWPHPVLGDLDGDGFLDVFQNETRYHYFRNDGTNHFALVSSMLSENESAHTGEAAGTGDLDGDSLVDLVGPRTIRFGDGTTPHDLVSPHGGTSFVAPFYARDFEDDGDTDMLSRDGRVGTNDGTGSFPLVSVWPSAGPGNAFFGTTAFGDFNGDGRTDYLVLKFTGFFPQIFLGMTLLVDNGLGAFADAGIVLGPSTPQIFDDPESQPRRGADIDGDGDEDLPFGGGYYPNAGGGTLLPFVPLFAATESVHWADYDADGDLDALSLLDSGGSATYSLQIHQARLSFTEQVLATRPSGGFGYQARFLDLDGDADLDIALPVKGGPEAALLFERQGGAFLPSVGPPGGGGGTKFVGAFDVDGDGLLDLVCDRVSAVSFNATNLQVHRRVGPGLAYEERRNWMAQPFTAFLDIDEDGDGDALGTLVVRNRVFQGPEDGIVRQFGAGSKGSSGAVPVLGASGPLRPGSTTASLRFRRGLGGAPVIILYGFLEGSQPGVIPGANLYVQAPFNHLSLGLLGTAGVAGQGELTVNLGPLIPAVSGLTPYHQLVVLDPGAQVGGLAASNGLALTYGQ
ncbi:MAG TPA: VCBS repeat-containing protein [Planctomycetota bacterium]|nr:VCBS repeat-containing protein [Planctomycetota bacterium]